MSFFELLTVIGSVMLFVISIAGALFRYAVAQKQAQYEATFDQLRRKNEAQDQANKDVVERLHQQELHVADLRGQLALANVHKDNLVSDIAEIKSTMVTKSEFATLSRMLEEAVRSARRPGEYRSQSSATNPSGGEGGQRR